MRIQKAYAYCGPVMMVFLLAGLLTAGWLPVPGPNQSAATVAHDYQAHTVAIRVGMMLALFGAALLGPWVALLASAMRRPEDGFSPAAYCQLALGSIFIFEFVLPFMVFEVAAFRPDRAPAITLAISDLGWILLVGTVSTAVVELALIGVTIRSDQRADPVFPRWAATFSFVVAAVFSLGAGAVFVKHGPFAWNGLLSFWVPLAVFGAWLLVMTVLLLRAIEAKGVDEANGDAAMVAPAPGWQAEVQALSVELSALRAEVATGLAGQPTAAKR